MNRNTKLAEAAVFVVHTTRNAQLSLDERKQKLMHMGFGKVLRLLYPFRFLGIALYCAGTVIKPKTVCYYQDKVVEDHASGVIRNSLKRYHNINIEQDSVRIKPEFCSLLYTVFSELVNIANAFKATDLKHFSEFAELATLFRYYIIWKAVFRKRRPVLSILARTNDKKRTALGVVSNEYGIPVIAYSVIRTGLRRSSPYKIELQLCWTTVQKEHLEKQGIKAVLMPVPEVEDIRVDLKDANQTKCGILLNAKCVPVKLHHFIHIIMRDFKFEEIRESLWDYLDGIDIVFALNTNAIIDSLLHGVPVVYVGNLDVLDYDLHGFVKDGLVLPFVDSFRFPESVINFYSSNEFKQKWNKSIFTTDSSYEKEALRKLEI